MNLNFRYGKELVNFPLPFECIVDEFSPREVSGVDNPESLVTESLLSPFDFKFDQYSGSNSVAIAINDKTRPVPHDILIPPLLEHLEKTGIRKKDVCFIIANGTHVPMKPDEYDKVLPERVRAEYKIYSHDCDDQENLDFLGYTSRGTPIYINKIFSQAELRIVIGNIEPHHFMGFSGGVKSASIGLGGRLTITQNHSLLLDTASCIGEFESNPMRQEVEEIGRKIDVNFALNAILNNNKEIIHVLSGKPSSVMLHGIKLVNENCQSKASHLYDLAIASAGGYPKDINLYQSQKALTNSARLVKDDGIVILAAECVEGVGSQTLEKFMIGVETWQQVVEKFQKDGFQVGPHKALQIAQIAKRVKIILVSSIDPKVVRKYMLIPAKNMQEAVELAKPALPSNAQVAFLPMAVTTIPRISGN